jgi:ribosome recycling factor
VDYIKVDYHGTSIPLNQIATILAPEARLVIIQPWDKGALASIERAILKSELGLNPTNDGNMIRLVIPPLTEERRLAFVKRVQRRAEEGKIVIRNLRREAMEKLKGIEGRKEISQDDYNRASSQVQKLTDSFIAEVDQIAQGKETEIMEV